MECWQENLAAELKQAVKWLAKGAKGAKGPEGAKGVPPRQPLGVANVNIGPIPQHRPGRVTEMGFHHGTAFDSPVYFNEVGTSSRFGLLVVMEYLL